MKKNSYEKIFISLLVNQYEEKMEEQKNNENRTDKKNFEKICLKVNDWDNKIEDIKGFKEADFLVNDLKILANPIRLKILLLLLDCEQICNCELEFILNCQQTLISHHLADLRKFGLIEYERMRKWKLYRLTENARSYLLRLRELLLEQLTRRKTT